MERDIQMSKSINISPGWELVIFDDGMVDIQAQTDAEPLTKHDFNRLAMHAPLVNRMRGLIGLVALGGDETTEELIKKDADKLLAEIAELEAK